MMRRSLIPTAIFTVVAATYLLVSGAPARVNVVSVGCLALAYWLPAVIAGDFAGLRSRWPIVGGFATFGVVAWDFAGPLVIAKTEPFGIARNTPWAYLLAISFVSVLVALTSLLSSVVNAGPLNKPVHLRDASGRR